MSEGKLHTAYYGVTQSGKTTLARRIARDLSEKGHVIIVHDPVGTLTLGGGWPESAIICGDEEELLSVLEDDECPAAHVFIDEAGDVFGHTQRYNSWLATKGRHFGLYLHIITQRPKMILPSVRNQVGRSYVFRLARDDMREVGADNGFSDLHLIDLDAGDFMVLNTGSAQFSRANIFNLLQKETP